jgi:hypothetical protein
MGMKPVHKVLAIGDSFPLQNMQDLIVIVVVIASAWL